MLRFFSNGTTDKVNKDHYTSNAKRYAKSFHSSALQFTDMNLYIKLPYMDRQTMKGLGRFYDKLVNNRCDFPFRACFGFH